MSEIGLKMHPYTDVSAAITVYMYIFSRTTNTIFL